MPAIGDQHTNAPANPFEDTTHKISEYTALQIATLQQTLRKQLGPEYLSTRKGPGGKNVNYIASEKVIGLANEVFGFNGWSSTIRDIQVDFVDENVQTRKVDIGLSVIVRVTLKDGTFHEDIGYGHIENCSGKAAAFEKAKKEGTTDGLKRSLRNFGNLLGNCVYDKEYLNKVMKIKVKPVTFDANELYRHKDFVTTGTERAEPAEPVEVAKPANGSTTVALQTEETNGVSMPSRRNSVHTEGGDEFGSADFDDADFSFADLDHPDETPTDQPEHANSVPRNGPPQRQQQPPRPPIQAQNPKPQGMPQNNAAPRPPPKGQLAQPNRPQNNYSHQQGRPGLGSANGVPGVQSGPVRQGQPAGNRSGNNQMQPPRPAPQQQQQQQQEPAPPLEQPIPPGVPTGFLSAKAVEPAQNGANLNAALPQFNPRAESPSIRKTAGVDHTKSMGIKRAHVPAPETPVLGRPVQPDMGRRLGAPQNMPSPLANRGQFKPPAVTGKRSADGFGAQQQNRTALNDVTAASVNTPPATHAQGPDTKRPRLENGSADAPTTNVA